MYPTSKKSQGNYIESVIFYFNQMFKKDSPIKSKTERKSNGVGIYKEIVFIFKNKCEAVYPMTEQEYISYKKLEGKLMGK